MLGFDGEGDISPIPVSMVAMKIALVACILLMLAVVWAIAVD